LRSVVPFAVAVAVALALGAVALVRPAAAEEGAAQPAVTEAQTRERKLAAAHATSQVRSIKRYRKQTWAWQKLMRTSLTPTSNGNLLASDVVYRQWVLELWRKRALVARRKAHTPPRLRAWKCIQRHEGPWNDPHAPYYGGLQMDLTFQRHYGAELLRRKGTADNWTPLEQIWVAERAYRSGRGFYPWPNTARACGLI
jgi:hypothetical protein